MSFIQFQNITKTFGGVVALSDVSLSIERGQCHALMGENGAGKSTLGKSLAGIHKPDSGTISINGKVVRIHSPADASALGIGMVHQELAFCPDLSIAENLTLGKYPRICGMFLSRHKMRTRAVDLLNQIGVNLDVNQPMRSLSTAQEQLVQIAAAIGTGAKILIFDEPTSSLSEREVRQLFVLIDDLKRRGVTMIYVSHRMPEVYRLCDSISVLRDGKFAGAINKESREAPWPADTENKLVQLMIGRTLEAYFPQHLAQATGKVVLSVKNLNSPGRFSNIDFEIRAGEILGFAGLVGAGRSEIARALFGLDQNATGEVQLDGEPLPLRRIRTAIRRGMSMVPEDRKRQGLVLMMGCRQNFSLAMLPRLNVGGFLNFANERRQAEAFFGKMRVKTASLDTPVSGLSGGNQQKVVLAKWLAAGGKLLIVDEPTRGVDVGAKAAIHGLIDDLAKSGVAVMLISSELPEVISLSTRILVMRDGAMVGELSREQATQESVLRLMAGVSPNAAA